MRKSPALSKAVEALLYALPVLLPFCIWLALQGQFTAYQPTAADVCALASGFIVLVVFIVQQHLRKLAQPEILKELRDELDQLRNSIKALRKQAHDFKQLPTPTKIRTATIPPVRSKQEGIFKNDAQLPLTDAGEHPLPVESDQTPASPSRVFTDDEMAGILKARFTALASLPESNADRLATALVAEILESRANPYISIIYRDAAVEDSQVYRLRREDVQIASPGIVVAFQSGITLLFPAPMAGQDCFHDVKAFDSNTPRPSQKRSCLAGCEPAQLSRVNDSAFQLNHFGRLDFRT